MSASISWMEGAHDVTWQYAWSGSRGDDGGAGAGGQRQAQARRQANGHHAGKNQLPSGCCHHVLQQQQQQQREHMLAAVATGMGLQHVHDHALRPLSKGPWRRQHELGKC